MVQLVPEKDDYSTGTSTIDNDVITPPHRQFTYSVSDVIDGVRALLAVLSEKPPVFSNVSLSLEVSLWSWMSW